MTKKITQINVTIWSLHSNKCFIKYTPTKWYS